jgi:hypothetical protein
MDSDCHGPDDCAGRADIETREYQPLIIGNQRLPSKDQMQSENLIKCAHGSCRCLVEVEDQFCSPACANAKDAISSSCPCGHPECVGAEEAADEAELELPTETS